MFIFYYKNKQSIVTSDGIIKEIDLDNKTLKIKDMPEREYGVPDIFICENSTVIYNLESSGELIKINFENLKIAQKITITFDFLNSKVYKIIVKSY